MNALQQQLTVEIEFWREMIDQQDVAFPPSSLERMKQALALAEHKLLLLMPMVDDPLQQAEMAHTFVSDRRH